MNNIAKNVYQNLIYTMTNVSKNVLIQHLNLIILANNAPRIVKPVPMNSFAISVPKTFSCSKIIAKINVSKKLIKMMKIKFVFNVQKTAYHVMNMVVKNAKIISIY